MNTHTIPCQPLELHACSCSCLAVHAARKQSCRLFRCRANSEAPSWSNQKLQHGTELVLPIRPTSSLFAKPIPGRRVVRQGRTHAIPVMNPLHEHRSNQCSRPKENLMFRQIIDSTCNARDVLSGFNLADWTNSLLLVHGHLVSELLLTLSLFPNSKVTAALRD